MQELLKAYWNQDIQYFSTSKKTFLKISEMPPVHAANAADKLLRESQMWSDYAGQPVRQAGIWMVGTALFGALLERSTRVETEPEDLPSCFLCRSPDKAYAKVNDAARRRGVKS